MAPGDPAGAAGDSPGDWASAPAWVSPDSAPAAISAAGSRADLRNLVLIRTSSVSAPETPAGADSVAAYVCSVSNANQHSACGDGGPTGRKPQSGRAMVSDAAA